MNWLELLYRGRRFRVEVFYTGAARDTWRPVATEIARDGERRVVLKGEHAASRLEAIEAATGDLVELVDREMIDPFLLEEP